MSGFYTDLLSGIAHCHVRLMETVIATSDLVLGFWEVSNDVGARQLSRVSQCGIFTRPEASEQRKSHLHDVSTLPLSGRT